MVIAQPRFRVNTQYIWLAIIALGIAAMFFAPELSHATTPMPTNIQTAICNVFNNLLVPLRWPMIVLGIAVIGLGLIAAPLASRFSQQVRQQAVPVIGGAVIFSLAFGIANLLIGGTTTC